MALITVDELRAELRVPSGQDTSRITRLHATARALVDKTAPEAPEAVRSEAIVRIASYIYDQPNYVGSTTDAFRHSGAATLLRRWVQRRGIIVGGGAAADATAAQSAAGEDETAREAAAAAQTAAAAARAVADTNKNFLSTFTARVRAVVESVVPSWARAASPPTPATGTGVGVFRGAYDVSGVQNVSGQLVSHVDGERDGDIAAAFDADTVSLYRYSSDPRRTAAWTAAITWPRLKIDKATNVDIDAETDDAKYTTTAKVFRAIARKVKNASTTVRGIVLLARNEDVDASETDTTRVLDVAKAKRLISRVSAAAAVDQTARNAATAAKTAADINKGNLASLTRDTRAPRLRIFPESFKSHGDIAGTHVAVLDDLHRSVLFDGVEPAINRLQIIERGSSTLVHDAAWSYTGADQEIEFEITSSEATDIGATGATDFVEFLAEFRNANGVIAVTNSITVPVGDGGQFPASRSELPTLPQLPPFGTVTTHPAGIAGKSFPDHIDILLSDRQTAKTITGASLLLKGVTLPLDADTPISGVATAKAGTLRFEISTSNRDLLTTNTTSDDDSALGVLKLTFSDGTSYTHRFAFLVNNSSFTVPSGSAATPPQVYGRLSIVPNNRAFGGGTLYRKIVEDGLTVTYFRTDRVGVQLKAGFYLVEAWIQDKDHTTGEVIVHTTIGSWPNNDAAELAGRNVDARSGPIVRIMNNFDAGSKIWFSLQNANDGLDCGFRVRRMGDTV